MIFMMIQMYGLLQKKILVFLIKKIVIKKIIIHHL